MQVDDRAEVERLCRELVLAIAFYGDRRDADEGTRLFTVGATWLRAGILYTGLDQIRESFFVAPETQVARHLIGTPFVTVKDSQHASSVTYYSAYVADPGTLEPLFPLAFNGPFTVGEWHDEFVLSTDGWRFTSRVSHRIFQNGDLPTARS